MKLFGKPRGMMFRLNFASSGSRTGQLDPAPAGSGSVHLDPSKQIFSRVVLSQGWCFDMHLEMVHFLLLQECLVNTVLKAGSNTVPPASQNVHECRAGAGSTRRAKSLVGSGRANSLAPSSSRKNMQILARWSLHSGDFEFGGILFRSWSARDDLKNYFVLNQPTCFLCSMTLNTSILRCHDDLSSSQAPWHSLDS